MSDEGQFQRVAELFERARDLPPGRRTDFLRKACADAPVVLEQVSRLLEHHEDDDGLLRSPIVEPGSFDRFAMEAAEETQRLPERIGRYAVRRRLGAGGMGAVYMAEQENPRREVAVKVIRPGLLSRDLLRRFELEAAMLGRLRHPGIAQIYEAGMFDDGAGGQPYFAMEYIEGPPLLEYAACAELNLRERLELFARICDAVHHAHQRGIIHRDLKPGNILVDPPTGQPKILDFGVARATDSDLQVTTLQTSAAQLIGTLPYMSPEQVVGRAHDIDVRADVYALGVILYELLTGRLPYDLTDVTVVTAANVIAAEEPTPPATINRACRGDLNTIVLKALEKDPERRYHAASDLAADVRRYLADEPIVARPATTMYQLRKFARRNRGLVIGVAVAFLAVSTGAVAALIGMLQARTEADRARSVNDFMTDILVAADIDQSGPDVKLLDVLRDASATVEARFADYPQSRVQVHTMIGRAFAQLGALAESRPHWEQVYQFRRDRYGLTDPRTLRIAPIYVNVLSRTGGASTALDVGNEFLSQMSEVQRNGRIGLEIRRHLANPIVNPDGRAGARRDFEELFNLARKRFGDDDVLTRHLANDLAATILHEITLDRSADPVADTNRAAELLQLRIREPNPLADNRVEDMRSRLNLADALRRLGQIEEARQTIDDALQLHGPYLGEDNDQRGRACQILARVHWTLGDWRSAAENYALHAEINRRRDGDSSIFALVAMSDALHVLEAGGLFDRMEEYSRILLREMGGAHADAAFVHQLYLARALSARGDTAEAETIFRELAEAGALDISHSLTCTYHLFRGEHHLLIGNRDEARRSFEEARRLRALFSENDNPIPARIDDSFARLDSP